VVDLTFGKPYWEDADVRTFFPEIDDAEYVWHRDAEDREIEVLEGEGWRFQVDKCLPWLLKKGMVFDIPEGEYHRLIRGVTPLKCRVIKHDNS
jgi:quercetin dioxygenase-like cupin family protein